MAGQTPIPTKEMGEGKEEYKRKKPHCIYNLQTYSTKTYWLNTKGKKLTFTKRRTREPTLTDHIPTENCGKHAFPKLAVKDFSSILKHAETQGLQI